MINIFSAENLNWIFPIIKSIALFVVGYFLASMGSKFTNKACQKYATPQQCLLVRKSVFFLILFLFLVTALQQLGFNLSVLLGSAGIATAAVGFASKTTISNMISGVFLIIEKSFSVGDQIKVKGITGKVSSIDLLSVKLITPDNTLVRIPNETMLNTEVTNLTKFPKRRLDISIGIAYEQDFKKAHDALINIAKDHPLSLDSNEPKVTLMDFGDSAINIRLSVWVKKKNFGELKKDLNEHIKKLCDANLVLIPYPQLTVHMSEN